MSGKVYVEFFDSLGDKSDLNFGGTGIVFGSAVFSDNALFYLQYLLFYNIYERIDLIKLALYLA